MRLVLDRSLREARRHEHQAFLLSGARADFAAFDKIMKRKGGEPPTPEDQIP